MTHLGYLLVGWGVSLGCGAAYAVRLIVRGRALSARVPAEQRRWMTSDSSKTDGSSTDTSNTDGSNTDGTKP